MAPQINTETKGLVDTVVTKDEQDKLIPADVVAMLFEGNARFAAGEVTLRNHKEQIRRSAMDQFPKAIVLSCVDSRIPVEDVFDCGIGDVFVGRVAGNFVNTDLLGSMEFACAVAHAKLIVVLGHARCGAVKGAIDNVELGHITSMVANIRPAIEALSSYSGERSSTNPEFVLRVAEMNVALNIERIRRESAILADLERTGKIAIIGCLYSMETGEVRLLDESATPGMG